MTFCIMEFFSRDLSYKFSHELRKSFSGGSFLFQGRRADVDIFQRLGIADTDAGGITVAQVANQGQPCFGVQRSHAKRTRVNAGRAADALVRYQEDGSRIRIST